MSGPGRRELGRREFLADVGHGMFLATLGSAASLELGLAPAIADDSEPRLTFGALEGLTSLLQETPPDDLLPLVVAKMRAGEELKTLVAAAALANARAFGGQDYTGYHTFMALLPAFQIAAELPADAHGASCAQSAVSQQQPDSCAGRAP